MTNAIEQAKKNMYSVLEILKGRCRRTGAYASTDDFEGYLESYLELLRQDHEALHETARARFEDIQKLEAANQDLIQRLAVMTADRNEARHISEKMIEERDSIQLRLHAVDHAYKTQQDRMAIPVKDSVDRGAYGATEANAAAIQGAAEDIRKISDAWAMTGRRAKKSMLKISGILARPEVFAALEAIENPATCMHSFHHLHAHCIYCGERK